MSIDYGEEKRTCRDRLLALLVDNEWHDWSECESVGGMRYSARILELRRLGHHIERQGRKPDGCKYRLTSKGSPQPKRVRVYLDESDAEEMLLLDGLPLTAAAAIVGALASYDKNRDKL